MLGIPSAVLWMTLAMTVAPSLTAVAVGAVGMAALRGTWWVAKTTTGAVVSATSAAFSPASSSKVLWTTTTENARL
jgi:hypothetical protein